VVKTTLLLLATMGSVAAADRIVVQPELSLRIDGGPTFGKVDSNNGTRDLSYTVPQVIGFQLDAGVRLASVFHVGAYLMYGIGMTNHCAAGSCSSNDIRLGGEVAYHFLPKKPWDPWVGIGMGWERGHYEDDNIPLFGNVSVDADGLEYFHLDGGVDFRVADSFKIGPFFLLTASQFNSENGNSGGGTISGDINNKATHGYFLLGVRGVYLH
jgi:hypothetical protein